MSAKRKAVLQDAIDVKDTAVRREREDDRAALEKDQTRAVNDIAGKMRPLIDRYAKEKGYSAVLEASSPESSVITGANDIISEIVTLYDQTYRDAP